MLHTDHQGHIHRHIIVLVFAVLHIIDIIEELILTIQLLLPNHRLVTLLPISCQTTRSTYSYIEEEARGTRILPGLQLVLKT